MHARLEHRFWINGGLNEEFNRQHLKIMKPYDFEIRYYEAEKKKNHQE